MKLQITNLSKTYANGVKALQDINLTITSGMFGLVGPNGAGKSTLMRTLATLQQPDTGNILFGEIDILKNQSRLRRQLGYLPQDFGLYPDVTAEQLLNHIALLKGMTNRDKNKKVIQNILVQTNLYDLRKRKLGTFSGGMKQRFGIAQALLGNPKLIIVDEPTAGLDPEERNRFHNLLSEISENIIVILSTHIVDDVRQLCSQMAIIHYGKILFAGSTGEALKSLHGKVWQKIIEKSELTDYDNRYHILLTRLFAGKVLIHTFSETQPDGFEPIQPDLEDVYFATIKNNLATTRAK